MESKSLPPHLSTLRQGFMLSGDPRSHLIMAQNGKEMLSSPSPGVSMETVPALPLLPSASREEWGSCLNEAGGSAGGSGDCYSVEPPYLFEATNQRESRDPPPPPRCVSSGMSQQRLESSPLPLECSFLTNGLRMFETLDHLEVTPQPLW